MFKKLILTLSLTLTFGANVFAAPANNFIYRSVGPDAASALASGTSPDYTLSISGSTATFNDDIPENVGVGDAIEYDSDDNGSIDAICFIHGRTDSRNYTVKNAAGGAPTATSTADGDWKLYRAYTSLYNAESGDENDSINDTVEDFDTWSGGKNLTSSDEQWNIACYANGTTADSTPVVIDGWTTDATRYIRIYTPTAASEVGVSQRHDGKRNINKYRFITTYPWNEFVVNVNYVRIDGLQISVTAGPSTDQECVTFYAPGGLSSFNVLSDTLVYDCPGVAGAGGIHVRSGKVIFNNVVSMDNGDSGIYAYPDGAVDVYIYNSVAVNNGGAGFRVGNGRSLTCKNCYAAGNAGGDYHDDASGDLTLVTSHSGDTTGNTQTAFSTSAGAYFTNVTAGSEDVHIKSASALKDAGTDLSADPYWVDPGGNVDIDREGRQSSAWDVGADEVPFAIYRSVGVGATSPLASGGSNALSISGSTAAFAADLPSNVGVGDAIQYDSDNGGTIDSICFIHGRTDARHYTVKKANGTTPTAISTPDNDWAVYRAYTSLYDAERGVENTGISDTVENFDTWSNGRDLVTNGEQWNIACYENGSTTDDTAVDIEGWSGSAANYLRIYTPVSTNEVGVSQRHKGYWGTGYRRTGYLIIRVGYVYVDGLSIRQSNSNRIYFVYGNTVSGEVRISNCFGQNTNNSNYDVYDIFTVGPTVFKVWNNIGINDSTSTGAEAFFLNDADVTGYFYNNTGIANAGRAFLRDFGTGILKNNIGISATGYAFYGTWTSADYNASDDATADDWGGTGNKINQTFSFVDQAADDFHLAFGDTGAKGFGVNLFQDPNIAFSDDIDGEGRAAPWSIGADGGLYQGKIRNVKLRAVKFR